MDGPAQVHRSPCSLQVAAGGYGRSIRDLRERGRLDKGHPAEEQR